MEVISNTCNNIESILNIDRIVILNAIKKHGIIILKGFNINRDVFSSFIDNFASKVTADPARDETVKNAQLIQSGTDEMGLHLENGNAPFVPDLQFFFCEKAPRQLSQTTYCDGHRAYLNLSSDTAELLADRKIMYTRTIKDQVWQKYFSKELGMDVVTYRDIIPHLPGDTEIKEGAGGDIEWRVRRHAVYDDPMSNLKVQAHSILAPSFNYDIPRITWSDGGMINPSIFSEISASCRDATLPMELADRDLAILNNKRVMHGREKILDQNRVLLGGQGYL